MDPTKWTMKDMMDDDEYDRLITYLNEKGLNDAALKYRWDGESCFSDGFASFENCNCSDSLTGIGSISSKCLVLGQILTFECGACCSMIKTAQQAIFKGDDERTVRFPDLFTNDLPRSAVHPSKATILAIVSKERKQNSVSTSFWLVALCFPVMHVSDIELSD